MSPNIALYLCAASVLFLLWLEHKKSTHNTGILWIPTIWMLYTASKPLGVWLPSSGGSLETSPLDRAFLVSLILVALGVLFKRKTNFLIQIKNNYWIAAIIIYMLTSISWSSIPAISFNRWIREFQAVIMASVVLTEPFPRQAMESILRRSSYILIPFSLLLVKYFPIYGVDYGRWSGGQMWLGVTTHKNSLGRLCMVAIFFLCWEIAQRLKGVTKPLWKYQSHMEIVILLMAIWLMRGPGGRSYSATSIAGIGIGLLVYYCISYLRNIKKVPKAQTVSIVLVIMIIFGVLSVFASGATVKRLAPSAGRDITLTGRTDVWAALVPVALEKALLGHGFGSFWTTRTREIFKIPSAHNGYLDVILELGFLGLLLFSGFLIGSCGKAMRMLTIDFEWGALWISYLVMVIVHNIAESSINSFTSQLTAIILFITIVSSNSFCMDNKVSER